MMQIKQFLLITTGVILVISAGCNQGSAGRTSRPVQYPSTWPIQALTVPSKVKQIPMHQVGVSNPTIEWDTDGEVREQGLAQERKRWEICFEPGQSGKEVADHIDACLKPLGFRLYKAGTPPQGRRMYISKDYKTQVNLDFLAFEPIELIKTQGWEGYRLSIAVWARPRPDISSTEPIP